MNLPEIPNLKNVLQEAFTGLSCKKECFVISTTYFGQFIYPANNTLIDSCTGINSWIFVDLRAFADNLFTVADA